MELLVLGAAVILLSFLLSLCLLIAFINLGVLAWPEKDQFASKLYWRKEKIADQRWQIIIYGLSELRSTVYNTHQTFTITVTDLSRERLGTDKAILIKRQSTKKDLDVFPLSVKSVTAAHEWMQIEE